MPRLVLVEVGTRLGPAVIEVYRAVETLGEWVDVTRRTTLMAYDFHAEHPGIAALMLTRAFGQQGTYATISSIAFAEADALVRAGLPQPDAYRIYQTLARFTLAEIAADTSDPKDASTVRRAMFVDGVDVSSMASAAAPKMGTRPRVDRWGLSHVARGLFEVRGVL